MLKNVNIFIGEIFFVGPRGEISLLKFQHAFAHEPRFLNEDELSFFEAEQTKLNY